MCVDHTMGITTIPKYGMLCVTEVSHYFWYDIHTSFFAVKVLSLPCLYSGVFSCIKMHAAGKGPGVALQLA